jgi:phospholipid transport system substrate-binding protein
MNKIKNIFSIVAVVIGFSIATAYATSDSTPVAAVQEMSKNVLSALKSNQSRLNSKTVLDSLVNSYFMPYINKERMAQMVVGRNYWNTASVDQRDTFIRQFKDMVVSTYAAAIASYDGDKVRIYRSREDSGSDVSTVKTAIVRKSGQVIPINYYMSQTPDGWKVYDFSVENISMVNSYRAQFAPVLAEGGVRALNVKLQDHNKNN